MINIKSKIVIAIINGAEYSKVDLMIVNGAINHEMPITKKIFAMLDPITLPIAILP